jgi:hypothetical protein
VRKKAGFAELAVLAELEMFRGRDKPLSEEE